MTHGSPTNQSRAGRSLDFGAVWICQRATGAHALTKSGELELLTMVRFHRKSWLSLLCVLATVGCSKTKQLPVAPAPPPPPQVTEVFPAARSTQVDYASAIRVQFDAPVNPSSVDPRNVYLKIDTVRQPIALSLDAGSRTIRVIPQSTLSLFTTYTVELSPALQFADGQRLGNTYLWQFTTVSVRHPVPLAPHDRGFDSPFAPLLWGGNESTAGMLIYDLYEGTDSVTIDHRGLPTIYRGGGTRYIPNTRWPGLGPNFWAVTIENLTSGERSDGPVWRFDTPTADAPVDSLVVSARNWGYRAGAGGCIQGICGDVLWTGPAYATFSTWSLPLPGSSLLVAGIHWDMSSAQGWQDSLAGGASLWASVSGPDCNVCGITGAIDGTRGALSSASPIGPRTIRFASDTLSAFVQGMLRFPGFFGFRLTSAKTIQFVTAASGDPAYLPSFKLYFYPASQASATGSPGEAELSRPTSTRPPGAHPTLRGLSAKR